MIEPCSKHDCDESCDCRCDETVAEYIWVQGCMALSSLGRDAELVCCETYPPELNLLSISHKAKGHTASVSRINCWIANYLANNMAP